MRFVGPYWWRASSAVLRSADASEDAALQGDAEGERKRVRDIIEAIPPYRNEIRDLRVRARRALHAERDRSMLSRIEALAEHGSSLRDLTHGFSEAARKPRLGETFDLEAFRRFVGRRARRARGED